MTTAVYGARRTAKRQRHGTAWAFAQLLVCRADCCKRGGCPAPNPGTTSGRHIVNSTSPLGPKHLMLRAEVDAFPERGDLAGDLQR